MSPAQSPASPAVTVTLYLHILTCQITQSNRRVRRIVDKSVSSVLTMMHAEEGHADTGSVCPYMLQGLETGKFSYK